MTAAQLLLLLPCLVAWLGDGLTSAAMESRAASSADVMAQRRAYGKAAVFGDYLYIEGGEKSNFLLSGERDEGARMDSDGDGSSTKYFSLSQRWYPRDITLQRLGYKSGQMTVLWPSLWVGKTMLYRWGGELSRQRTYGKKGENFFAIEPVPSGGGKWFAYAHDVVYNVSSHGATTTCEGVGYTHGGVAWDGTGPYDFATAKDKASQEGMVMFNTSTRVFSRSTADLDIPGATNRAGQLVCVPGFLDHAVVALLGGTLRTSQKLRPFDKLAVFDAIANRWREQDTLFSPQKREDFCAVGARSKQGTFEIFVYGGKEEDGTISSDVFILSLPLFRWFRVTPENTPKRHHHTCALAGQRQVISFGGLGAQNGTEAWKDPDPWPNTIGVFDMTELKWKDEYIPDLGEYETPDIIWNYYKDNELSNVKWNSDEVKEIFTKKYFALHASGDKTKNNSDSSSDSGKDNSGKGSSDSSSSVPIAPIVGGVVGGLALLAIIAGAIFFCRRRRKQQDEATPTAEQPRHPPKELWGGNPHSSTLSSSTRSPAPPYVFPEATDRENVYELDDNQTVSDVGAAHHRPGQGRESASPVAHFTSPVNRGNQYERL